MQYATMRGQSTVTVTVPKLEGGVNLSDLPTQVEDNQLTDVRNMWWHQGVLRTRPGLKRIGGGNIANGLISKSRISEREEILFQNVGGGSGYVTVRADSFSTRGRSEIGTFTISGVDRSAMGVRVDNEKPYLIFTGDGKIRYASSGNGATDAEPYVPHVTVERRNEDGSISNIKYEDYNMLTPSFKCSFSSDGKRTGFSLPVKKLDRCAVTVVVTVPTSRGTREVTFNIPAPETGSNISSSDYVGDIDLYSFATEEWMDIIPGTIWTSAALNYDTGELGLSGYTNCYDNREDTLIASYVSLPFKAVTSNNIVVSASKTKEGQRETICRMTQATWFGGARSGLDGGTRLFVTGNPKKPNLVYWSDVNKPLYFPENNHFYVGDAEQRVTGFGKQGELLVAFKERGMYYSQYVAGKAFTADDLISGAVTDIAAMTAQFPLTPLHPTIGCDCPDTIRLVNNRLVWATSDAHVYMLPSVNQYSERNVRDITALIRRDLEKHTADELKAAVATEYKGHYMLILPDGTAYLLDVGNSAFQSYAYYASEKKANRALPWYIWKFGQDGERFWSAVSTGDELRLMANDASNREYTLEGEDDGGEPIPCSFTTKLFDFGRGDVKKAITHLYIGVADGQPNAVRISYITDAYTAEDAYIIKSRGDYNEREAGYMRIHRLTPNIHRVSLFGIRCDSEGAMAADGIQIKMKPQGVVR